MEEGERRPICGRARSCFLTAKPLQSLHLSPSKRAPLSLLGRGQHMQQLGWGGRQERGDRVGGVRGEWELEALAPKQTTQIGQTWWCQAQRPALFSLHRRIKNQSGSATDLSLLGLPAPEGRGWHFCGENIWRVGRSLPASEVIHGGRRAQLGPRENQSQTLIGPTGFATQAIQASQPKIPCLSSTPQLLVGGVC